MSDFGTPLPFSSFKGHFRVHSVFITKIIIFKPSRISVFYAGLLQKKKHLPFIALNFLLFVFAEKNVPQTSYVKVRIFIIFWNCVVGTCCLGQLSTISNLKFSSPMQKKNIAHMLVIAYIDIYIISILYFVDAHRLLSLRWAEKNDTEN